MALTRASTASRTQIPNNRQVKLRGFRLPSGENYLFIFESLIFQRRSINRYLTLQLGAPRPSELAGSSPHSPRFRAGRKGLPHAPPQPPPRLTPLPWPPPCLESLPRRPPPPRSFPWLPPSRMGWIAGDAEVWEFLFPSSSSFFCPAPCHPFSPSSILM